VLGLLSFKKLNKALNFLIIYDPKGNRKFIECVMNDISYEKLGYRLTIVEYIPQKEYHFDKIFPQGTASGTLSRELCILY